ncbi:DUF6493 family protein [Erythrobacter sp. MTPC3]|uniref:DUF7825 domain-containing protein n=1 Tax=Erythrobacter sp. MTPC3 TaxID=3056564 RepID=UPI0036F1B1A1
MLRGLPQRAREPLADWSEEFKPLGVTNPWPGGVVPAIYEWSTSSKAEQYADMRWRTPIFKAGVEQTDRGAGSAGGEEASVFNVSRLLNLKKGIGWEEMPAAAVHQNKSKARYDLDGDLNTTWVAQWLAYIWPQNPAYAYFGGARLLVQRVDDDASNWNPSHGFFKALFVRGRVWGEAEHLLLSLGLVGKDADAKGLAIDAMIEGIETRQFNPALFAHTMARLANGGWLKLNRVGETLKQVIEVSPLHANAIGTALQDWLPHFDLSQRNSFYVLEAMVEAQAIAPQPLSDEVRKCLGQSKGKTKAAKLAQQILS